MAFHYQPSADLSSDEEGGAAVNPAAWQSGAKRSTAPRPTQAPAPTASMVAGPTINFSEDDEDELAADPLAVFQSGPNRKRKRNATSTPAGAPAPIARMGSGFTSINQPSGSRSVRFADDEVEMPDFDANNIPVGGSEDEAESAPQQPAQEQEPEQRGLVPIVPRVSAEVEEVVDMTGGEDVVRRVLGEVEGRGAAMVYRVELGDYSIEEVCSCSASPCLCSVGQPAALHCPDYGPFASAVRLKLDGLQASSGRCAQFVCDSHTISPHFPACACVPPCSLHALTWCAIPNAAMTACS